MKEFGRLLFAVGILLLVGAAVVTSVYAFGPNPMELPSSAVLLQILFAVLCSAVGARLAGFGRRKA